jgi:hypothetical protein
MFSFFLNEEIGIIEMFFSHDIIKENLNSEENSNFERLIGDSETNRTTVRPLSFQILVYV